MIGALIATIWALLEQLQKNFILFFERLVFLRIPHWRLPPGPLANWIPVFGSLPLFAADPTHLMLTKIATKYEKIYRLRLGKTTFVVICDPTLLQETFARDSVSGRNMPPMMDVMDHQGLVHADGEFWWSQRAFVHQVLHDIGLPRTMYMKDFDKKANEAIFGFQAELQNTEGRSIFIDDGLCVTLINIFFSMIVGRKFSRDDRELLSIISASHESFRVTEPISLANFIPFFAKLPFNKKILHDMESSKKRFIDYMTPIVQEHRLKLDAEHPKDLIDAFLVQMELGKCFFTEPQLYHLLGDLFTASLESTAATIHWILLALVKFPGIQQKIYDQIRELTKNERAPTLEDRESLPYLVATILEGYRFPSVLPYGVPHGTSEETIIAGYRIPKKSTVVGLFWKFNRDPKLWYNPNCFDPDNHFDGNGVLIRRPYLMPFSVGRRICISETVAHDTIYLILANLIYKFVILEADDSPAPSMDDSMGGLLRAPLPFKVRMVSRHPTEQPQEHHD